MIKINGLEKVLEYLPQDKKIINKLKKKDHKIFAELELGENSYLHIYSKNGKDERRIYMFCYSTSSLYKI